MSATPAERTLAAECRAVEEGHYARLAGDGRHFLVTAETHPGLTYHVGVAMVGETIVFSCDHLQQMGCADAPSRSFVPDKHCSLAARRLSREGLLRWDAGRWVPTAKALQVGRAAAVPDDPFQGLPT